jgi:SacI restriction endonuclease
MIIDKKHAEAVLLEQAKLAEGDQVDAAWTKHIEVFSEICERTTRTHIAFLGTALLAKSVSADVDIYAVKARSLEAGAYSARSLAHGVLVPFAPQLGINLGVTGREPLNNQPYFRIMRVSRDIPIHGNAKPALEALCDLLEIADTFKSTDKAKKALRAFIFVRRKYVPSYNALSDISEGLTPRRLVDAIETFVTGDSEGGKRAQAVAAGFLDMFAGKERVETSRINDPDRHLPGDVGVRDVESPESWEKMFEVRDKPVTSADLYHFAQKAVDAEVKEAAFLAVAGNQKDIDLDAAIEWAIARGVSLSFFRGWRAFAEQILFWGRMSQPKAAKEVAEHTYRRIVELEVSQTGAALWLELVSSDHE